MIVDELSGEIGPGRPRRAQEWFASRRVQIGAAAAALLLLVGVALDWGAHGLIPSAFDCAEVTRLTRHPTDPVFTGAALGPLMLSAFAPNETRAVVDSYHEGYPVQVLLVTARPYDRALSLSGWRCADRRPLRFSLAYPFLPPSPPAPSSAFVLTGENSMFIRPFPTLPDAGVVGPDSPWFLFDSTGRWVIELRDGDAVVGRVTIEVLAAQ